MHSEQAAHRSFPGARSRAKQLQRIMQVPSFKLAKGGAKQASRKTAGGRPSEARIRLSIRRVRGMLALCLVLQLQLFGTERAIHLGVDGNILDCRNVLTGRFQEVACRPDRESLMALSMVVHPHRSLLCVPWSEKEYVDQASEVNPQGQHL